MVRSDTITSWKRGLLKAWLALSLIWAAGLLVYLARFIFALEAGWDIKGLLIALGAVSILPLGALPPMLILGLGMGVFWISDRIRGR